MSVLAELEKRLEENEKRIVELIQHLERQHSLEQSFDDTRQKLGEAGNNIGDLAASTRVAIESLQTVLRAFQSAVGILQHADPAQATEAVARIEGQIEASDREVKKVIEEVAGNASRKIEAQFKINDRELKKKDRRNRR